MSPKPDNTVTSASDIPKAYVYVCATDNFMSGWGPCENRKNRIIFPCCSWEQAEVVKANLCARREMSHVTFCSKKPRLHRRGYLYQVLDPNKGFWNIPGAFSANKD